MCDTKNLFFTDLQITMTKESVFPWEQFQKAQVLNIVPSLYTESKL